MYCDKIGFIFAVVLYLSSVCKSNPLSQGDSTIEEWLKQRENMIAMDKILKSMEEIMAERLYRLFNKVNSLSLVADVLAKQGADMGIVKGNRDDMASRCPKGFQAVPGDKMCYYLSTYKQPWGLAQEQCFQLGPNVEPVTIDTTKRQFVLTHLIQSDPDARKVKKWWTAAKGVGNRWTWHKRISRIPLFLKFFENERDALADGNSCVVLDSDYYYQWKKVKCASDTADQPQPTHHFICQQPARQPIRTAVSQQAQLSESLTDNKPSNDLVDNTDS